jgi:hypothetical protein
MAMQLPELGADQLRGLLKFGVPLPEEANAITLFLKVCVCMYIFETWIACGAAAGCGRPLPYLVSTITLFLLGCVCVRGGGRACKCVHI